MRQLDARRLTGLNVIWNSACAVVDVALDDGDSVEQCIRDWNAHVERMLAAVGWQQERTASRRFAGGASFALSAPIDGLYAAVELAEWALQESTGKTNPGSASDFEQQVSRISTLIRDEANPSLLRLADEAASRNVAFLWDDDEVSVGLGKGSKVWPSSDIPVDVDWSAVANIPVGLVTGTNGKTTTARLASHIIRSAGGKVGLSSTDWVGVDGTIIERGDFSGPGGARTALRQPGVDVAVLETARGGLLRRGLGVQRADAAVITNIAEDHLGDFGSQNLDELLDLKWIVTKALDQESTAILNADDPLLLTKAKELSVPIVWFSTDSDNVQIARQVSSGQAALSVVDGSISRYDGSRWRSLCPVVDIPITLQGAAKHNVANALSAVGLCWALGIPDAAITSGLKSMTANENPGRCNLFHVRGAEVLVDFAHNPDAMEAIFAIARDRPAKRRILCFGQAGDRTDEQIRALARAAWAIGLQHVVVSELADYHRGRDHGDVYALLKDELLRAGARENQISHNELEVESLDEALKMADIGDLVIVLALGDTVNVLQQVRAMSD